MRTTALVIEADAPVDNASRFSNVGRGTVRILAQTGGDPIYTARKFLLDEDHWVVRGMEIPIAIDPDHPEKFEIDWDAVPGIEKLVAANEPALADPRATRDKVSEAMRAAGQLGPDLDQVGPMGEVAKAGAEARKEATPDRFAEAMEKAAQEPAPPDKQRAVVMISSITASLVKTGGDMSGPSRRDTSGRRRAVLSVSVPGREPYAVFERRFKHPRRKAGITDAGLPALVSSTDPNDVDIQWDEVPGMMEQVNERLSDGLAGAGAEMRVMEAEGQKAIEEAIAKGPPPMPAGGTTPPAGAGTPQMTPEMQKMIVNNAKQALKFVQDPAMREMMLNQYRAAGIEIDESDL